MYEYFNLHNMLKIRVQDEFQNFQQCSIICIIQSYTTNIEKLFKYKLCVLYRALIE